METTTKLLPGNSPLGSSLKKTNKPKPEHVFKELAEIAKQDAMLRISAFGCQGFGLET